MRRARLFLAALVLTTAAASMLGASAAHCDSGEGRPHDPFGSCEHGDEGHLECGSGPEGLPVPIVPARTGGGAQVCLAGSDNPFAGRAGVWSAPDGTVTVFVDGDDANEHGSEVGWRRVDVNKDTAGCEVRVRKASGGQWANDYENPGETDSETDTDECHTAPE